jgi:hypothetical protein
MFIEPLRLTPDLAPAPVRRDESARLREARTRSARDRCRALRARIAAARRRIARGEDLVFGSACCLAQTLEIWKEAATTNAPSPAPWRHTSRD